MLNRNSVEYELDNIIECAVISDYDLEITITVAGLRSSTDMSVSVNGEPIHRGYLADGDHVINHRIHVEPDSELGLSMHTSMHRHGQKVFLKRLRINKVDLLKSNLWITDMFKFTHTDGRKEEHNNGLYHNGTWKVTMPTPVFPWLTKERNKRSSIVYREHLNFSMDGEDYYKLLDDVFR
jgi:hypothetical protein